MQFASIGGRILFLRLNSGRRLAPPSLELVGQTILIGSSLGDKRPLNITMYSSNALDLHNNLILAALLKQCERWRRLDARLHELFFQRPSPFYAIQGKIPLLEQLSLGAHVSIASSGHFEPCTIFERAPKLHSVRVRDFDKKFCLPWSQIRSLQAGLFLGLREFVEVARTSDSLSMDIWDSPSMDGNQDIQWEFACRTLEFSQHYYAGEINIFFKIMVCKDTLSILDVDTGDTEELLYRLLYRASFQIFLIPCRHTLRSLTLHHVVFFGQHSPLPSLLCNTP